MQQNNQHASDIDHIICPRDHGPRLPFLEQSKYGSFTGLHLMVGIHAKECYKRESLTTGGISSTLNSG